MPWFDVWREGATPREARNLYAFDAPAAVVAWAWAEELPRADEAIVSVRAEEDSETIESWRIGPGDEVRPCAALPEEG